MVLTHLLYINLIISYEQYLSIFKLRGGGYGLNVHVGSYLDQALSLTLESGDLNVHTV